MADKYLNADRLTELWAKIKNLINKKSINRGTMDSSSTSTAFVVSAPALTELYDGATIIVKNTVVASASGCTMNVNGLGAKRIIRSNGGGYVTSHWALNATYLFVYSGTNDRWEMQQGYWSDNNTWRGIQVNGTSLLGTGTGTGAVNFVSGSNVSVTGSGNDITISSNFPNIGEITHAGVDVTQSDNGVSSNVNYGFYTKDSNLKSINKNGVTVLPNGNIQTDLYAQNYNSNGDSVGTEGLHLGVTKNGDHYVSVTTPSAWLSALGITNSSITLSPESGATIQTGGAYRFGPIVVINVVFKLTKSFANDTKICTIPTQNTESRFMAYTGTDAWFAGKAMMPCRFHSSALKPIGATPTASSTNPIYLYVNQTYITSAS